MGKALKLCIALLTLLLAVSIQFTSAATLVWSVPSGDLTNSTKWNIPQIPSAGDILSITNNGIAYMTNDEVLVDLGTINVGNAGSGSLVVSNTATWLGVTNLNIGNNTGSVGTVTLAGRATLANVLLSVGAAGNATGSALFVTSGAQCFVTNRNSNGTVGLGIGGGGNNVVYVGGSNGAVKSTLDIGRTRIDTSGMNNYLIVDSWGVVTNAIEVRMGGAGNGIIITNGGWFGGLGGAFDVPYGGAHGEYVCVVGSNGAVKSTLDLNGVTLNIGGYSTTVAANTNYVVVDRGGVITNGNIIVGSGEVDFGNYVIITNGGQVFAGCSLGCTMQSDNRFTNSCGNYAEITGAGSLWNLGNKNVTIGNGYDGANSNYMIVANGGLATNVANIYISNDSTNGHNYGNYMILTNGGSVFMNSGASCVVGNNLGGDGNFVVVAGRTGSTGSVFNLGTSSLKVGSTNFLAPGAWLGLGGGGLITNCALTVYTNSDLRYSFNNDGPGSISCSAASLNGSMTLGFPSCLVFLSTNAFTLIHATGAISNNVPVTNASVFTVGMGTSDATATLDIARRVSGSIRNYGSGFSLQWATNAGWVAISTNGITGPTFEMPLLIGTNGSSHTVADLAAYLTAAGYTATNRDDRGYNLFLTIATPQADPAYFSWDFTSYDPGLAVSAIRLGPAPCNGTVVLIK